MNPHRIRRRKTMTRVMLSWFVLLLLSMGAPLTVPQAIAQTIARGPYLQLGTATGMVVRWRTSSATNSRVQYGNSPTNLTSTVNQSALTTEHEVALTGLTPSTLYYYWVGTSTQVLAGGDASHFFVTSPVTGTAEPTRIWVIGDSGTANASARAVRDAYLNLTGAQHTDLWLMLGDNAYEDGTDSEYQSAVFNMYPTLLRQSVVWPTLGNHDGHSADSASQSGPYYNIFTLPKNGEAGGVASGTEAYYSFDFGNIHFVVLDSFETSRAPNGAMLTWLRNDLAATRQPWIVAFWHHPPYSKSSHDSDSEIELIQMRQNALPILEAAGVDLVLSGHSHSYERSFLIDGHYGSSSTLTPSMIRNAGSGRVDGSGTYQKSALDSVPNEGAVYAVAGSSGQTSGGSLNHPAMFISLNSLGSMVLDVNGNRLDARFIDQTGATRDYFTVTKGGAPLLPAVTVAATDATATEAGTTTGTFTVTRTGATTAPLTVAYSVSGTATSGSDYTALSGSVTIAANAASATITVTPINDTLVENNETVIATLSASSSYTIGTPAAATITITSDDVNPALPVVSIVATDATATEAGPTTGTFTVTRNPATAAPLTVSYSVGGTASSGSDYTALTGSVTIPAGAGSATITVTPINDTAVEPNETLVVSLSPDGAYLVGTPGSATVTIVSDDVPPPEKDLVIEGLALSAGSVPAGSSVTASYLVANRGTVTVTETYTDKLYLSTNATLDAGDVLLGTSHGHTTDLAPNATHAHSQAVTVPAGTAAGTYFVVVQADSLAAVIETNEGNNVTAVPLAVTLRPPTLLRSPTANAADSGGDGNGFESSPGNSHADDTLNAVDNNSGTGSSTSCTSSSKDKHRFYNYGFTFPAGVSIRGIEVRLDARVDSTSGSPKMCVQLSWNGGSTWTSTKSTPTLGTSMGTFTLGSPTNTWSRSWTTGNFTDANFRVRVINVSSSTSRDFSLDWVAVSVHYQ